MNDNISRQQALDTIRNIRAITGTFDDEILLIDKAEVQTVLMMLPPTESRKKGKWIKHSYGFILKNRWGECSICGNTLDFAGVNAGRGDANYCPNCGADMRGEQNE